MISNNLNINTKGKVCYITFPKLENTGIVKHLFSTRLGGVSTGRYQSMNLSFLNGDQRENVLKNYQNLCECVGIDIHNLVLSRQTHTDNIKTITADNCGTGIFKESFNSSPDFVVLIIIAPSFFRPAVTSTQSKSVSSTTTT